MRIEGLPGDIVSDVAADVLPDLVSAIRRVLGDGLAALYLYGSAVSGGFDRGVSDLDLVAVTSSDIETIDLAGLDRMHHDFVTRHPDWRDRIEIVYVGRATLESFRTSRGSLAVISPGEAFHVRADNPADWLQNWYLVRETSVALHGPDPAAMVPPISRAEFVAATTRYAAEIRSRSRAGASAGTVAYAILTMCRALRTVRTGRHGSKQDAAAWVRGRMPEWAWIVDAALESRLTKGERGFDTDEERAAAETFIARLGEEIAAASGAPATAAPRDRPDG